MDLAELEDRRKLTQKALIDALTPLFGPKGIVAAHVVLFVSVDDGHAMPVTCSFALHPELMAETLPVAVGLLESAAQRGHDEAFAIAVPVKQ